MTKYYIAYGINAAYDGVLLKLEEEVLYEYRNGALTGYGWHQVKNPSIMPKIEFDIDKFISLNKDVFSGSYSSQALDMIKKEFYMDILK